MVEELVRSDWEIKTIYHTSELDLEHLDSVKKVAIAKKDMEKLTHMSSPSSIAALIKFPTWNMNIDEVNQKKILVLDAIRDPGNLGTIIRSADWFGIHQIIASTDTVDCFNPKVIQASMGSVFRVQIFYADLGILGDLKALNKDFGVLAAMLDGESTYNGMMKSKTGALIIGNESNGVSEEVLKWVDKKITIPRFGEAESLNAAVSASILLHEWVRS